MKKISATIRAVITFHITFVYIILRWRFILVCWIFFWDRKCKFSARLPAASETDVGEWWYCIAPHQTHSSKLHAVFFYFILDDFIFSARTLNTIVVVVIIVALWHHSVANKVALLRYNTDICHAQFEKCMNSFSISCLMWLFYYFTRASSCDQTLFIAFTHPHSTSRLVVR